MKDSYHLLGFAIAHTDFMKQYLDSVKRGAEDAKKFLVTHGYNVDDTWIRVIELLHTDAQKRKALLKLSKDFAQFMHKIPNPKI